MQWQDEAIILRVKKHGETSVILEVLTQQHGRHLGLVRGGRSSKQRSILQPGNQIGVTWRARLDEHLGSFSIEAHKLRAADVLDDRLSTYALGAVTSSLCCLAERDPTRALFQATEMLLNELTSAGVTTQWLCEYIGFEIRLLRELGVHLDLSTCASTGQTDQLRYISPKSGRAVSEQAAEPYKDRLLALPEFLRPDFNHEEDIDIAQIKAGFKATGYFLNRHIYEVRGLQMPFERDRLVLQYS